MVLINRDKKRIQSFFLKESVIEELEEENYKEDDVGKKILNSKRLMNHVIRDIKEGKDLVLFIIINFFFNYNID